MHELPRPVRNKSILDWANKLVDALRPLLNPVGATLRSNALVVDGSGTSLSGAAVNSTFRVLSYDSAARTATISAGILWRGFDAGIQIPETTVSIPSGTATSPAYVYVVYNTNARTAQIGAIAVTDLPHDVDGQLYTVIHSFYYAGGLLIYKEAHHVGNIYLRTVLP